jgi:hypothetical protein
MALLAGSLLTGCESVFPVDPLEWRQATVRELMPLSALPFYVDRRCTPAPTDAAHADKLDAPVALVSYRVGRYAYLHAFEVGESQTLGVGDEVLVQPRACGIKRR